MFCEGYYHTTYLISTEFYSDAIKLPTPTNVGS